MGYRHLVFSRCLGRQLSVGLMISWLTIAVSTLAETPRRELERGRGQINSTLSHLPDNYSAAIRWIIGQCSAEWQQAESIRCDFADNIHGRKMLHQSCLRLSVQIELSGYFLINSQIMAGSIFPPTCAPACTASSPIVIPPMYLKARSAALICSNSPSWTAIRQSAFLAGFER